MEYKLKLNEETVPLLVKPSEGGQLTAVIGDRTYDVGYAAVDDHHMHLTVNGRRVNAFVGDQNGGKLIVIQGKTYFVRDAELLLQNRSRKKGMGADSSDITPPMPAIVISVAVATGDVVKKGQAVVIVSAMKMETTLVAPFDGTVTKVNVGEGDKVMPGDILVDIEKTGPDDGGNAE